MRIFSFFARVFRGGSDGTMNAARVGQRRDVALALSGLLIVALAVAIGPGMKGKLARAELQPAMSAGGLNFSDPPHDQEFLRTGLFKQPLVPSGPRATTPKENRDLAAALVAYATASRRGDAERVEAVLAFLDKHPESPWRAALEVDIGAAYRLTGHFSKALAIWQRAWDDAKGYQDPNGRAMGDAAAGYLSQMEAYLGRKESLAPLLDEIKKRPVRGSATQLVDNSAEGLASMLRSPQESFRCGPMALARILQLLPPAESAKGMEVLGHAMSTPNGLSLSAVQQQSVDAGMGYQMAFRAPGAPLIVPAVAHWKVGHFAAVLREYPGGRYLVGDLTFGGDLVVGRATIDDEASGYFLVPPGPLPEGWRSVDTTEGDSIWGRGYTGDNHDIEGTGHDEIQAFDNKCESGGCTTWNVDAAVASLSMHDTPVGYTPPVGPPIRFDLDYSHRDAVQPSTFSYTNFGNKWTTNWLAYLRVGCDGDYGQLTIAGYIPGLMTDFVAPTCVQLYRQGGGAENYFFANDRPIYTLPSQTSSLGQFSQAYLTTINDLTTGALLGYLRLLPDGSSQIFKYPLGTGTTPLYFLTDIYDPQGNHVQIAYDGQGRITTITDAIGQNTTVCYNDSYLTTSSPCAQPPAATAPDCTNFPQCNLMVTQVVDPFARSAFFGYGQGNRLVSITDVLGIKSSYDYYIDQTTSPPTQTDFIDWLSTPYGKTTFTFQGGLSDFSSGDSTNQCCANCCSPSGVTGDRSVSITDPLGRTSFVEYLEGDTGAPNCSSSNVLPSDPWAATAEPDTHIPCSEPNGPAWNYCNPNQPALGLPGDYLQYRNTFIWDAYQWTAPCPAGGTASNGRCYPNAKAIHWLHTNQAGGTSSTATNPDTASRTPESIKPPLDSRIYFMYANQSQGLNGARGVGANDLPTVVARVINDAGTLTTQAWQYSYNIYGNVTQVTDPRCRQLTLAYPPSGPGTGVDLASVTNTTCTPSGCTDDVLLTLENYVNHRPQKATGANGQATNFTYDGSGQVLTVTDATPQHNTWTYCYTTPNGCATTTSSGGYLQTITGPNAQGVYSFTYDGSGRVQSTKDPSGEVIKYLYDAADRPTLVTYPDKTTVVLGYTNLDLTSVTDRAGNITTRTYDADRELGSNPPSCTNLATPPPCCATSTCSFPAGVAPGIHEPGGRTTVLNYWGNKTLESITDPNGNITTMQTDLEGRIIQQGFGLKDTYFVYDDGGRLVQRYPDANGGSLNYTYYRDDTVATVQFDTNNTIDYFYDGAYKRLTSWTKSNAGTEVAYENYTYFPATPPALGANRLSVDTSAIMVPGSPGLTLTFTTEYKTNAGAPGYDELDRVTSRLFTSIIPNESIAESWQYDALGRLETNANTLDTFTYGYMDATARVSTVSSTLGPLASATYYTPQEHDGLLQSLAYTYYGTPTARYDYVMDSRHNITSFTEDVLDTFTTSTQYANTYPTYDAYSQLNEADQTVTTPTSTTSTKTTYGYDLAGNLTRWFINKGLNGHSPLVSTKYDAANEITTRTTTHTGDLVQQVQAATYDAAGNLQQLAGTTTTYPTDIKCTYEAMVNPVDCKVPNGESKFTYDGMGRLTRAVQSWPSGAILSDKSYVWCGNTLCARFDNTGGSPAPDMLYFDQGNYYFNAIAGDSGRHYEVRDALGSVRGVVTDNKFSPIVAQYEYDSYGNQTPSGNAGVSDFGFAGMYTDSMTGLNFARNRVYSPTLGRWLSRDPIGQAPAFSGGTFSATNVNLYAYVANNPTSRVDPTGLAPDDPAYWEHWQSSLETAERQDPQGTAAIVLTFEAIGMLGSAPILSQLAFEVLADVSLLVPAAKLIFDDQQVGWKFGEHMSDLPGYRNPAEYRALANAIFNNPNAVRSTATNGDILYRLGNDILRVSPKGNIFVSLYACTK